MTRIFATLLIMGSVGFVGPAQAVDHQTETKANKAALKQAKVHTWRRLYRENDVTGLDAFLSEDFIIIGANGTTQTKAQILAEMKVDPWTMPDDFLYTVTGIVFPTPGSAIVYGHGDSTRQQADGSTCQHNYTSSNVFRLDTDAWRPVSSHVSDASCE